MSSQNKCFKHPNLRIVIQILLTNTFFFEPQCENYCMKFVTKQKQAHKCSNKWAPPLNNVFAKRTLNKVLRQLHSSLLRFEGRIQIL